MSESEEGFNDKELYIITLYNILLHKKRDERER